MPAPIKPKQQLVDQLVEQVIKAIPAAGAAAVAAAAKADWASVPTITPTARLRHKIEATAQVADRMRQEALADGDLATVTQAKAWAKQARQLRNRLDLPVTTSKVKHRRQIKADLTVLHQQMGPTAAASVESLTALSTDPSRDTLEPAGDQQ